MRAVVFFGWMMAFWVGAVAILGTLFWPLYVWPTDPVPFFMWFGFLVMNLFAVMFAAEKF